MRHDVLELLRDRNPVPVDPPAPPIDSLLARLDETTGSRAADGDLRPPPMSSRGGRWGGFGWLRRGVAGWGVVGVGAAVAAIVIAVLAGVHGRQAPIPSASGKDRGLIAPALDRGRAWYYVAVEQDNSPWQPPGSLSGGIPSLPPTGITTATRSVVVSRFQIQRWTTIDGAGRDRARQVGKSRFIGSASDRALWLAKGGGAPVTPGSGGSSGTTGFEAGNRTLGYSQVLHFPTDPTAVIRFLGLENERASQQLTEIQSLLETVPLSSAARVAVFAALARIPGIENLGSALDPIGRPGVALGAQIEPLGTPADSRRFGARRLRTRSELVFDPRTKALLAAETVLLEPSHIADHVFTWTAYIDSRAVSTATVPTLRELLGRHQPPTASPAPPPTGPQATTTTTTTTTRPRNGH